MKLPCNLFNNSDAKQGRLTCGGAISIRKNSSIEISIYHRHPYLILIFIEFFE